MKNRLIATCVLLAALCPALATAADESCATLVGAGHSESPQGFQLRDGEPVDFVSATKTVHGKLLVFSNGDMFRVYWQPDDRPQKYVLANADTNAVRLVESAPQGSPAPNGGPGVTMPPQHVLSCPAL
ncbi:hypothetical protein [Paraburkholderia sp. ZP32-5]|uniref:hypothetical protein n=1 Tax=Paraburkholderia sp. ZP32-5 TaxID=2883245 RepID=UPI001F3E7255|nr:hypothetical protein [Paraburkholderia sp. ZP32-5]